MHEDLVKRLRIAARLADKGLVITPSICLEAADAIEELQDTVQAQDKALKWCADQLARRWTPVTERLPDCEGKYLCKIKCTKGEWIEICILEDKDWYSSDEYEVMATDFVTHWMPLPELPIEKEEK